jgi:TonB family protein
MINNLYFLGLFFTVSLPVLAQTISPDSASNEQVFLITDKMPSFKSGEAEMHWYIEKNTVYPKEARGVNGKVYLSFVIARDGKVRDVKVLKGLGKEFDMEAVRVLSSMPDWEPGRQNGKAVNVQYTLSVSFFDKEQSLNADSITVKVDKMPEFKGGFPAMLEYMANTIVYPEEAKRLGIKGKVLVTFAIDTNGLPTDIKVVKGIGGGCDKEAVRIIKSMPAWSPAYRNGKKVKQEVSFPIGFDLPKAAPVVMGNVYYNSGVKSFGKHQYKEAMDYFTKAINYDSLDNEAIYNRGVTYIRLNLPENACQDWRTLRRRKISDADGLILKYCKLTAEEEEAFGVDSLPSFIGGEVEFMKLLTDNIKYPPSALENGIQGKVSLEFIITSEGKVENIRVAEGIEKACDEEAVRVIKLTNGRWKPSMKNGKPVDYLFSVPVKYMIK